MPQIPKFGQQERDLGQFQEVRTQRSAASGTAVAAFGDAIKQVGSEIVERRIKARNDDYVFNRITQDMEKLHQDFEVAQQRFPDGKGVEAFIENSSRTLENAGIKDAPDGDSARAYRNQFSTFAARMRMEASSYENTTQARVFRSNIATNVNKRAAMLGQKPDASMFIRHQRDVINSINNGIGTVYSQDEAQKESFSAQKTLLVGMINGYIDKSPNEGLNFLNKGSSVSIDPDGSFDPASPDTRFISTEGGNAMLPGIDELLGEDKAVWQKRLRAAAKSREESNLTRVDANLQNKLAFIADKGPNDAVEAEYRAELAGSSLSKSGDEVKRRLVALAGAKAQYEYGQVLNDDITKLDEAREAATAAFNKALSNDDISGEDPNIFLTKSAFESSLNKMQENAVKDFNRDPSGWAQRSVGDEAKITLDLTSELDEQGVKRIREATDIVVNKQSKVLGKFSPNIRILSKTDPQQEPALLAALRSTDQAFVRSEQGERISTALDVKESMINRLEAAFGSKGAMKILSDAARDHNDIDDLSVTLHVAPQNRDVAMALLKDQKPILDRLKEDKFNEVFITNTAADPIFSTHLTSIESTNNDGSAIAHTETLKKLRSLAFQKFMTKPGITREKARELATQFTIGNFRTLSGVRVPPSIGGKPITEGIVQNALTIHSSSVGLKKMGVKLWLPGEKNEDFNEALVRHQLERHIDSSSVWRTKLDGTGAELGYIDNDGVWTNVFQVVDGKKMPIVVDFLDASEHPEEFTEDVIKGIRLEQGKPIGGVIERAVREGTALKREQE